MLLKRVDQSDVVGVQEPIADACRHNLSGIRHSEQVSQRGFPERFHSPKMGCESASRSSADMQDAQSKNQPPERLRLARLDACQEIRNALFPHSLKRG